MKTKYEVVEFETGGYGVKRTTYSFLGWVKTEEFASAHSRDIFWKDPHSVLEFCVYGTKEKAIKFKKEVELKHKVIDE